MNLSVFLLNNVNNTQNTRFWWCCFISIYRVLFTRFSVLLTEEVTFIICASGNIVLFYYIGYFPCILLFFFFYLTISKTLKVKFLCFFFFYTGSFVCVLWFWYVRYSKPQKNTPFLDNVLLHSKIMLFLCILAFWCLKHAKIIKKKTRFW